jgi:hypothetical protein
MSTITNPYLNDLSTVERSVAISAMPGPSDTQCNRRIGMLQRIGKDMQTKIESLTSEGRDKDVDDILANLNNAKLQALAKRKLRDEQNASMEMATMERAQKELEQVEIDRAADLLKNQLAIILSRLPREQRGVFMRGLQMDVSSRETGFQIASELNEENSKNLIMQLIEASIVGSITELVKVMNMSYENADKIANGILFIAMGYFLLPSGCQDFLNKVPFFGSIFELMSYMPKTYQQPLVIASGLSAIAEKAGLVEPLKGVGRNILNTVIPSLNDARGALQTIYNNVFEPLVDMIELQWNASVTEHDRSDVSTIASESQIDIPSSQNTIATEMSDFSSQESESDVEPSARRRRLNTPLDGAEYVSVRSNQSNDTIDSVSSDVSSTVTTVSNLYNTVAKTLDVQGSSNAQKVEAVEVAIQEAIPTLSVEGTMGVDSNSQSTSSSDYSRFELGGKKMRKSRHHKKSKKTRKGKKVNKKGVRKTKKSGKRAKKTQKRYRARR